MQQTIKRDYALKHGHESSKCEPDVPERTGMESNVYERYTMSYNTFW